VIPESCRKSFSTSARELKAIRVPHALSSCDHAAILNEGEVVSRCVNPLCPAILNESLKHFAFSPSEEHRETCDKIIEPTDG